MNLFIPRFNKWTIHVQSSSAICPYLVGTLIVTFSMCNSVIIFESFEARTLWRVIKSLWSFHYARKKNQVWTLSIVRRIDIDVAYHQLWKQSVVFQFGRCSGSSFKRSKRLSAWVHTIRSSKWKPSEAYGSTLEKVRVDRRSVYGRKEQSEFRGKRTFLKTFSLSSTGGI